MALPQSRRTGVGGGKGRTEMRTAFINQLVEEARTNDRIFLLVGDLGYNVVNPFAEAFPERFRNVGICEQNMAGMAGGLAMAGYNVFIYSIGNFPTLRCLEQIRNDITYYNGNVKIVSVGAGFAYGSQGMSHHATEDIGIMRTLPNMTVCSPSDPSEAKAIAHLASSYQGSMYIRLGKAGEKQIFPPTDTFPNVGDLHCYKETTSPHIIFATGSILNYVVEWLDENHIDAAVYSVPFIKPMNKALLAQLANRHKHFVIVDEHQKSCGLGSAILEQLADLYCEKLITEFPYMHRIEIDDQYVHVAGNQQYLREYTHLLLTRELFG